LVPLSNLLIFEGLELSFVTFLSSVLSALEIDLIAIDGLHDTADYYLLLDFFFGLEFKYNVLAMSSA